MRLFNMSYPGRVNGRVLQYVDNGLRAYLGRMAFNGVTRVLFVYTIKVRPATHPGFVCGLFNIKNDCTLVPQRCVRFLVRVRSVGFFILGLWCGFYFSSGGKGSSDLLPTKDRSISTGVVVLPGGLVRFSVFIGLVIPRYYLGSAIL